MIDAPPMSVVMSSFEAFLESALGSAMLEAERNELASLLPQLVGYNCLQLSVQRASTLCESTRFGHLIKMGYAPSLDGQRQDNIWADYEALPVASDCIDVALLHHVLEFATEPHQLLREATRTLTAGGHLLIMGFNPLSAWPLYQSYYAWRRLSDEPLASVAFKPMSTGSGAADVATGKLVDGEVLSTASRRAAGLKPIRQGRLAEWLSVLNFDVVQQKKFFLRPPINNERWLRKLISLEKWAGYSHLPLGMVYLTLARKRTLTLSPVSPSWRKSMRPARTVGAQSQTLHSIDPGFASKRAVYGGLRNTFY